MRQTVAADRIALIWQCRKSDYAFATRLLAATYARFYLEQEEGGDPAKKDRFYWMALGAFASKTVACTLEDLQSIKPVKSVREGLGKGNLWLLCIAIHNSLKLPLKRR